MAKKVVYYRVHEHAIQTYIQPAGEVTRLINRVLDDARDNAKKLVGVRTGRLRNNIKVRRRANQTDFSTVSGGVGANIGHAWWVEKGTSTPIHAKTVNAKGKKQMKVPKNSSAIRGSDYGHNSPLVFFTESVRGQKGQHYLERGLRAAMRQQTTLAMHVSVPGIG